ncbi:hypothetical protein Tco_1373555 [Tanacetum coccineum]
MPVGGVVPKLNLERWHKDKWHKEDRSLGDQGCDKSGGDVFDLIGDVDPTDEDRDIGMGNSTGVSASLGGEIFSGGKKLPGAIKTLVIVITLKMEAK